MSDQATYLERLRALMLEHLHVEVPSAETDLLETGLLDSLQLVDLLLLIEQHLGRRIPIESIDLDNLRSLSRLAELVGAPALPPASVREPAGRGDEEPESLHGSLEAARRGARPRG
jgi:acyl carrier protein